MAVRKLRHRARVSLQKNKMETLKNNDNRQQCKKIKDKKTLVIAQEIKFARLLADNDKRVRDKVLKNLKKWLTVRSHSSFAFTEMDFISIWKGLFYCMWMSDKMLIQEELAESLSKIVHCFNSKDTIILYTTCALKTLATEWFGIDQYRLDKFFMLVRKILRQTFIICKDKAWDMHWVKEISQIFEKLFLCPKTNLGFSLHITEIYLEELAKVSDGDIPKKTVNELIRPFVIYLVTTKDQRQMNHIMKHIFRYLIFQSDIGIEYIDKFEAWKQAGFPCTHLDNVEKVEISDMEDNSENEQSSETKTTNNKVGKPLDPRAGRVDVELPQILFDPTQIVQLLSCYKFHPSSTVKSRRQLSKVLEEYKILSEGKMPLGIKKVRNPIWQKKDIDTKKAAFSLIQFEKNLYSDKISNKRKRDKQIVKSDVNTDSDVQPPKKQKKQTNMNNSVSAKKKVKIVLNRNTEQHTSEYIQQVRKSPAIPFDANKKPIVGVLKASAIPSPVNPFYKKSLRS